MSYRQPRVPEIRNGETPFDVLRDLIRFLKDFALAAWSANNRRKQEIEDLKKRVDALEGSRDV